MADSVPNSADLERVLALPRRAWTLEAGLALAEWLTGQLITEAGRRAGWKLLPQQAIALWEFYENWRKYRIGFFGGLPVGSGKTLIMFLAAHMIGAKRPMLFVPANLRDDDVPRMFDEYKKYWASPGTPIQIEGYSLLSQESQLYVLSDRQPDFLGFDECHVFRNYENTASKRVGDYVDIVRGGCPVLAMTGTPKRKSIRNYQHVVMWCLREYAPVPISGDALQDWAGALDAESELIGPRMRPGQLLRLADQTGVPYGFDGVLSIGELGRAREGYRRRFAETPGVLIWDESSCSTEIEIKLIAPPADPILDQSFQDFRTTDTTPDGWPLNEAIEKWNHERQRGCGWFYYWDPRPPVPWMTKRYIAACFCRDVIKATAHLPRHRGAPERPLDTNKAVYKAFPDAPELTEWKAIEKTFKPNVVAAWISGSVIYAAADWAKGRTGLEAGIIWCMHDATAQAVATATGLPIYGEGGLRLDANGQGMPDQSLKAYHDGTPIEKLGSIILLFKSNMLGRNLPKYANALAIGWEPSAEYVEQGYLGRFHRQGQTRNVTLWVLVTSLVTLNAIEATITEARGVLADMGLTQKILTAHIDRSDLDNLLPSARWVNAKQDDD